MYDRNLNKNGKDSVYIKRCIFVGTMLKFTLLFDSLYCIVLVIVYLVLDLSSSLPNKNYVVAIVCVAFLIAFIVCIIGQILIDKNKVIKLYRLRQICILIVWFPVTVSWLYFLMADRLLSVGFWGAAFVIIVPTLLAITVHKGSLGE
ncbi:MAG: hypothetical protein LBU60_02340 [Clostridiales bacterium]|jgi:hypothetical protein|nr:hypothetical protein [Clostridiales bacterium]